MAHVPSYSLTQFFMPRPNIIFILVDDLGWRDLSAYGSSFHSTPNLDRLVARGAMFTDAYASSPVCSPTRASILTGRYPARIGLTQYIGGHSVGKLLDVPYFHRLPMQETTIASTLRKEGYQTWHVGKWHLGGDDSKPTDHGFDVNIGGCEWGRPMHGYFSPWKIPSLTDREDGEYLTDRLTDEAVDLLHRRDPTKPFFMNLWHYAVHTPVQAPENLVQKYEAKRKESGLESEPFEEGEAFPCFHKRFEKVTRRRYQSNPGYAAMMENLDQNVGRLLAELDSLGLTDNTLIVFTSDNGGLSSAEGSPTCNSPLSEGKGWMFDGGCRVPLIAAWPGRITPGTVCHTPVTSTDFFPTLLEAAQLPLMPNQHADGTSLMPIFENQPFNRGAIFWHYPHYSNQGGTPGSAIREGKWKLVEFFEDGTIKLFNLDEDIAELQDLSSSEASTSARLHSQLKKWREEMMALIPSKNSNYASMVEDAPSTPEATNRTPNET